MSEFVCKACRSRLPYELYEYCICNDGADSLCYVCGNAPDEGDTAGMVHRSSAEGARAAVLEMER